MKSGFSKAAFTLVELLVVISIILIATSILFVGGGGGGDGIKLSSAQRIASSIAQGARGQALLKNADTRLIVYSEANREGDPEKWLRYFGIVYRAEEVDADGNVVASGWKAATQGTYLPEGIYFDPELSGTRGWPSSATMNIDYPRQNLQVDGSGGSEYYYYEFNANGTMETSPDFVNAWLVIRAGTLKPGAGDGLEIDFSEEEKENLKSALIFRRVGSTTVVTDPDEISGN
jgi:prepilin-type N-terminal cleavage/methylation domain-containing protein